MTYQPSSNRMATFAGSGSAVSYDGMGNMTKRASVDFTYDHAGRMDTVYWLSTNTTNTLDYNGQGELARAKLTTPDLCTSNVITLAVEYFNFSPSGQLLHLSSENSGRIEYEYIWLDDLPIAQYQNSYDGSGTYTGATVTYLYSDHLGTPRLGMTDAGQVNYRFESDAFGESIETSGTVVRLRFPGQVSLGIEKINYNYFRDYDPQVGRYLESDPIGIEGGPNTYGYAEQNPLTGVDPLGLETCVVVTTNSWGIRNHSALYMSQGDGAPFLFDPSGAYARTHGGGTGDWLEGDAVNLKLFAEFHKPDRTEMTCQNTSAEEEKRLVGRIVNEFGPPRIASCAINVSNVVTGSPFFPNVTPNTFWPGNLYRSAGGKP